MTNVSENDIVKAIKRIVARNDRVHNSTWEYATRSEIARELGVEPSDISSEGATRDGPLGAAIEAGMIEEHPIYKGYFRVVT